MKSNKTAKWTTISFLAVILLLILVLILYFSIASNEKYKDLRHELYYLNSEQNEIQSEQRYLFPDSSEQLPHLLATTLLSGPQSDHLQSPFPQNLRLLHVSVSDATVSLVLSEDYSTLEPYQRNLANCCLYRTMTTLDDICEVILLVNGETKPVILTADQFVVYDHFFETFPVEFRLFCPTADLTGIESIPYQTTLYADTVAAELVTDLLILEIFPARLGDTLPEIKVNYVSVYDKTAHIDLADTILKNPPLTQPESAETEAPNTVFLRAIVSSLTDLEEIDQVRFTFDGETVEAYGALVLSKPLNAYDFPME